MPDPVFDELLAISELVRQADPDRYAEGHLAAVQTHPRHAAFLTSAASDEDLACLFPDNDELIGRARPYRPSWLAWQLVNAARWHCWLRGEHSDEQLYKELQGVLATMRLACRTKEVAMTAITALSIGVPEGTSVVTPYGTLSSLTSRHRRIFERLSHEVRIPDNVAVLESPLTVAVDIHPDGRFVQDRLPEPRDLGAHHIAIAALLTVGVESIRPTVDFIATRISPIAQGVPGGAWRTNLIEGPSLDSTQVDALTDWIVSISRTSIPDIALERTLAMATNNVEHVYAFIDSVIVWENLFGSGNTQELAFRIALNMSLVLSDDPEERARLFKEIKALYAKRSRVVHGGLRLEPWDALEIRRRTWALTLSAIARLMTVHPTLLGAGSEQFVSLALGRTNRPELRGET